MIPKHSTNPAEEDSETILKMPPKLHESLLEPSNERRLLALTGLTTAALNDDGHVVLRGAKEDRSKALHKLRRVAYHCQWGVNVAKVRELLTPPRPVCTMVVRLSAVTSKLNSHESRLTNAIKKL